MQQDIGGFGFGQQPDLPDRGTAFGLSASPPLDGSVRILCGCKKNLDTMPLLR
jgi:hypothetical protein